MSALLRQRDALTAVLEGRPIFTATVPIALGSTANLREHHAAKAKRVAIQRNATRLSLFAAVNRLTTTVDMNRPIVVRLVRQSPRLLDDDNLAGALKGVRDSVADWLGVDDRDERVSWVPDQAKAKTAAVLVEVYAIRGERT